MLSNGFDGTNVDYKQLRSYHMINNVYFFNTIRVKEVCLLASMISTKLKINITRDTKRKASLLYKWFDTNWDIIEPHLKSIHLYNENGKEIKNKVKNNEFK